MKFSLFVILATLIVSGAHAKCEGDDNMDTTVGCDVTSPLTDMALTQLSAFKAKNPKISVHEKSLRCVVSFSEFASSEFIGSCGVKMTDDEVDIYASIQILPERSGNINGGKTVTEIKLYPIHMD